MFFQGYGSHCAPMVTGAAATNASAMRNPGVFMGGFYTAPASVGLRRGRTPARRARLARTGALEQQIALADIARE